MAKRYSAVPMSDSRALEILEGIQECLSTARKLEKDLETTPSWRVIKIKRLEDAIYREKTMASIGRASLLIGEVSA